jgi:hypothetical protein
MTVSPRSSNALATASPMPELAPVITAASEETMCDYLKDN